jgi:hypothetical protein
MKRTMAIVASFVLAATVAITSLFGGGTAAAVVSGSELRGAVGGDFDTQLPPGSVNGADWGVDQTLRPAASNLIHDGNVFIVASGWVNGGGQTQPTTSDGPGPCTGSVAHPSAPAGDVCIYIAGGDNAANVSGYSIVPGTGGSRFGFKLAWDSMHNGDSFIDAVWAYEFP